MKYLILVLLLVGCDTSDKEMREELRVRCLDGVKYYFYRAYQKTAMAPKFNRDGKPEKCEVGYD